MRIQALFDQGSAEHAEDFHLVQPPFLVVADGVSPPYNKDGPLLMVGGRSAGAVVAKMVCDTFATASSQDTASSVLATANERVGRVQQGWGRPLDRADLLAGASVAAVKLGESVEIARVADAIVLWRLRSGEVRATENHMYKYEARLLREFAKIMREVGGNRAEAWERYHAFRCSAIREHANRAGKGNYSVLNGQPEAIPLFQAQWVPRDDLQNLIICSDGLVPFEITRTPAHLARWVFDAYDQDGLMQIVKKKRECEQLKGGLIHESQAEATAIAVNF